MYLVQSLDSNLWLKTKDSEFVNFRTWLHVTAILDLGVKTLNKYLKQRKILSIIADVASTRV